MKCVHISNELYVDKKLRLNEKKVDSVLQLTLLSASKLAARVATAKLQQSHCETKSSSQVTPGESTTQVISRYGSGLFGSARTHFHLLGQMKTPFARPQSVLGPDVVSQAG